MCVFASCAQKDKYLDAQLLNLDDFEEQTALKGKVLEFDDLIMRPSALQVYDSILVTLEYGGEKLCNLYNLNTKKKIGERLKRGQGPNEMVMPSFVGNNGTNVRLIDMATSVVYEYDLAEFVNNESPQPVKTVKLEESVNSGMQMVGNKYIGYPYFKQHRLYVFDGEGKKVAEFADFPQSTIKYSDMERTDAYYMGFASNGADRIAICYYMTDLIEIYDASGNLLKRMHGPEQFFSHFKEVHDEGGVTSQQVRGKNRDAYFSPCGASSHLFVLYNGGYVDDKDHSPFCKQLFTFSWDGTPKSLYTLDDPIATFCVDEKRNKIYGVSNTPDIHIVEYTY